MMQAMNTGHEGSITTLHANSPMDALNRLETMILMNEMEIPVSAVRGYIENAIELVIQIDRMSDGRRKVTSISEVVGLKDGVLQLNEIFGFVQKGIAEDNSVIGDFTMTKKVPKICEKLQRKGITGIKEMFK